MKVIMLQRHQKHDTGKVVEVNEWQGRLWLGMGVAKQVKDGKGN